MCNVSKTATGFTVYSKNQTCHIMEAETHTRFKVISTYVKMDMRIP